MPWVERALSGHPVWNIGQLSKADVLALDRKVRAGLLVKRRAYWCGLALKTVWHLPDDWSIA